MGIIVYIECFTTPTYLNKVKIIFPVFEFLCRGYTSEFFTQVLYKNLYGLNDTMTHFENKTAVKIQWIMNKQKNLYYFEKADRYIRCPQMDRLRSKQW